ncbi:MAG: hypothetical protein CFH18_00595 [Alphaproteobacteria bacterium MarineAlpha5_Bin8]|nr:MAG: hypothetical protein CFH17_00497 [Alphaproteobacteria bacterium MarineAlpha5_Bin7]PPR46467.1 MAG: hypothetical protein CFH18_00595 [Alphaproteobacteria bacterium MarineAlpha5_Bin8]
MDPFIIFEGFFQLFALNFIEFVYILNSIPIEVTWLLLLFLCFSTILLFLKFFGEAGLYVYTSIAIIAANIQVLKIVKFSFFTDPVALGTILFASTFLCTDILTEYYSSNSARKNILLGFFSFLFMTILMLFTIGFKPLTEITAGVDYVWALGIQDNLIGIFLPLPIFFCSSMIAYLFSQFFDVWFYEKISHYTNKRYLWFRNNFSTIISSFIDNSIFSIFAWIIFNPEPLKFNTVLFTFILGTFVLRIIISIFDTPFIYLAKYFLPKKYNE